MKTKAFDAVAWMRQRRSEIDREEEGLSWQEKRRKTLLLLENDGLWRRTGRSASTDCRRIVAMLTWVIGPRDHVRESEAVYEYVYGYG